MTDREAATPTGSGRRVESFMEDARGLSGDEFEDRHGSAFLLLSAAGLNPPKGPSSTEVILLDEDPAAETAGVTVLVFPVQRTERSVGHLVTVGRAANSDVVIPDISVSRFHAFLKRGPDGGFLVQDAGSTNGSQVNGVNVPTKEAGPGIALKTGDSLKLGQQEFTFLEAEALRQFVLKFDD